MKQVLGMDKVSVWFDGTFTEPRLNHPEGICVDNLGNIWCGGEEGEICRIKEDGSEVELMAKTGGFGLGMTIDAKQRIYLCDMYHCCVFRYDPRSDEIVRFADGDGERKMKCPNYALVDEDRGFLYVSDTQVKGPGIWRYDLETGEGKLWYGKDCIFANGLGLSPDGTALYLVESEADRVSRIPIHTDGSAGEKTTAITIPGTTPDGLSFDRSGRLLIACYEPSAIYRYDFEQGLLELLVHDSDCVMLAHPTNIAFRGDHELFCASLGRWHISVIDIP